MESNRGVEPDAASLPESTREALEEELRGLERLHDQRAAGLRSRVDILKLYIDDIRKIEDGIVGIETQLGRPPREFKNYRFRWPT